MGAVDSGQEARGQERIPGQPAGGSPSDATRGSERRRTMAELLLRYRLLGAGVEAVPLPGAPGLLALWLPDSGRVVSMGLAVADSEPLRGAGTGEAHACRWCIPPATHAAAALFALVELASEQIWLFKRAELERFSKRAEDGSLSISRYVQATFDPEKTGHLVFSLDFDRYLLESRIDALARG